MWRRRLDKIPIQAQDRRRLAKDIMPNKGHDKHFTVLVLSQLISINKDFVSETILCQPLRQKNCKKYPKPWF